MGEPGFWEDDGRFAVLGEIELRDRIEAGLRTRRLAARAACAARAARRPTLVRRAAQRLLLLDAALDALDAGEPADALLRVDGDPVFGPRIVAMYRAWARERGMRVEVAEERGGRPFRWSATVSGFAALRTLRRRPACTCSRSRTAAAATTAAACASRSARTPPRPTIVRRYRERPTPLVRDAVPTDHRELPRHGEPACRRRAQRADGQFVAHAQQRGRRLRRVEQRTRRELAAGAVVERRLARRNAARRAR